MNGQWIGKTDINRMFSDEVRAELARNRTTAGSLATVLGVSEATVYRRLKGDSPWTLDDAMAVAGHLGIPLSRLTNAGSAA